MYHRVVNYLENTALSFRKVPDKSRLSIPFYSQWESINLVDDILHHKINASDDPKWKQSGAKSKQEYEYWSWNLCGTACLKMILKYKFKKELRLFDLAQVITKYGGYVPQNSQIIDGLFYKPFIEYLKKEWHLKGRVVNPLSLKRIKFEISQRNFVMVSVNQNIRDENSPIPKTKTGHLLLVTGFDDQNHVFYLNNPSGYYQKSQKNHRIKYQYFSSFYSGRGIIIYDK